MKRILFTGSTLSEKIIAYYLKKGYEFIPVSYDLSEDEVADLLKDCDGYILGGDEIVTESMLQKAGNRLKAISFFGVGYENYIDIKATAKRGILVSNTPGANSNSVAEFAVSMILACTKNTVSNVNMIKQGEWGRPKSIDLRGKTIGIIGMGHIGTALARILFHGFGMNIVYYSRRPKLDIETLYNTQMVELEELLKVSDIISINSRLSDETRGMIGKDEFDLMKDGVILINTARAKIIDENALYEALKSGKVFRCALDGFYSEPINKAIIEEHPLLKLGCDKLLVTPHMAYNTDSSILKMEKMAISNVIAMLTGEKNYDKV